MFGLSVRHFDRYRQIGWLLYKYGRSDLVQQSGLLSRLGEIEELPEAEAARPEELAADLERLGPAYVKLGQLLSTRPDFLPPPYLDALSRLQDDTGTVSADEIRQVITEELGSPPESLFRSFNSEPLASASLGQVHRAQLQDGREVVVKVQRPGIVEPLNDDLEALGELSQALHEHTDFGRRYQLVRLVDGLKASLQRELNYLQEAHNASTLAANLENHPRMDIPLPVTELTTRRVLTMDYKPGAKITDLSECTLNEIDRHQIADDVFKAYLQQVLVDGVFHADPHPGNLSLTTSHRVVLMDFGLVVRLPPKLKQNIVKLVLALAECDGDAAANIAMEIGDFGRSFDENGIRRTIRSVVTNNAGSTVQDLSLGTTMMQLQQSAGANELELPEEIMLLGKTLMNLDKVVSTLDPEFNPNAAIRKHASEMVAQHSRDQITLTSVYQSLMESAEFAQKLPYRANKLLRMASENQLKVKVDAIDEIQLLQGVHKIANRITAGLIVAAMIIGASMIMRLETPLKIMGYPALAAVFFLLSAIAGSYLLWQAMLADDDMR